MLTSRRYSFHSGMLFLISAISLLCSGITFGGTSIREYWERDYEFTMNRIKDQIEKGVRLTEGDEHPYVLDQHTLIWETDNDPLDVVLRRAGALLEKLKEMGPSRDLSPEENSLAHLLNTAAGETDSLARLELYFEACAVRRNIAMANPLLDFDSLICMDGVVSGGFVQSVGYQGGISAADRYWRAEDWETTDWSKPLPSEYSYKGYSKHCHGRGPIVVTDFKTMSPKGKLIFEGKTVDQGRLAGTPLVEGGSFRGNFDLSFDGKEIAFSWYPCDRDAYALHLFTANIDGSNVVQLTDGLFADFDPCFLPNGRIAFISLRSWSSSRCQPLGKGKDDCRGQPGGQLWSMEPDGSDMIRLSFHETNELHPTVDNDGKLVYTRWDYIDRDYNAAHNMWTCGPDGTDPRAPHRNYPMPHSTMSGFDKTDKRHYGIAGDFYTRALPGKPGEYIAVAGAHHKTVPGTPILINTNIRDDNAMAQNKIIIGNCRPREGGEGPQPHCTDGPHRGYRAPWPLDENFYIAAKEPFNSGYGGPSEAVVLFDRFGNEEVLYPEGQGPRPLRRRDTPPALPTKTYQGKRNTENRPKSTIALTNVYESDKPWPENTKIDALRIIQIFPRPWSCPCQDEPTQMGWSKGAIGRSVLGTVPVEEDGSAYFEAPINCEIYFQALDEKGMAVQSMRSGTYVHPGENLSCLGCHEDKWNATPPPPGVPQAMQRGLSKIEPEPDGSCPVNFYQLVQPILRDKCVPCHQSEGKGPTDIAEYNKSLSKIAFYFHASNQASSTYDNQGYRTIPGRFGARESRMGKALLNKHMDRITQEEFRRLVVWLDANSMEFAACHDQDKQRAGETVWPIHSCGPDNPRCEDLVGKEVDVKRVVDDMVRKGFLAPEAAMVRVFARNGNLQVVNPLGSRGIGAVYDFSGREIHRFTIPAGHGRHVVRFKSRSRGAGSFIARVRIGDQVHTITFSHVH